MTAGTVVSCVQAIAISDTSSIIINQRRKVTRLSTRTNDKNLQDRFLVQQQRFDDDSSSSYYLDSQESNDDKDERYHHHGTDSNDSLNVSLRQQERFAIRGGGAGGSVGQVVQQRNKKEAAWVDGLKNSMASALAAAFSKTILAPFDTVKTLQQYHQTSPGVATLTLMEAAKQIMQRPGGFTNFYVRTKRNPQPTQDSTRRPIHSLQDLFLFVLFPKTN
jgi:Mitochondrial carrier protein